MATVTVIRERWTCYCPHCSQTVRTYPCVLGMDLNGNLLTERWCQRCHNPLLKMSPTGFSAASEGCMWVRSDALAYEVS